MDSDPIPPASAAPPPLRTPTPPVLTASAPPPRKRGRGWMILALILMVFLVLSLFGNFTQLLMHAAGVHGGPRLDETVLENNGSANKIAVIDVEGIITSEADNVGLWERSSAPSRMGDAS